MSNDNSSNTVDTVCECPKCGGTGRIEVFSHIYNGVCFWCDGAGKFDVHNAPRVEDPIAALARRFAREGFAMSYADAEAVHTALWFCDGFVSKIDGGWRVEVSSPRYDGTVFNVRDPRRIAHWVNHKIYRGEHSALVTSLDG